MVAKYEITTMRERTAEDGPGGPLAMVVLDTIVAANALAALRGYLAKAYPGRPVTRMARNQMGVLGGGYFSARKVA